MIGAAALTHARNLASALSQSPIIRARRSRSLGHVFGKAIIGDLVAFDAEGVLNDLGGAVGITGV
jgi:hypothetical protein